VTFELVLACVALAVALATAAFSIWVHRRKF
jgi:hypothetical protein